MHLIVAYAAPIAEGGRAAPSMPATPALDRLLAGWAQTRRDAGDESALSPPHERALAAALGQAAADGCLPWAARQASADGIVVGAQAWGLLTPVHWQVGSDGVHCGDPAALALAQADSRALCDALRPLFEDDGFALAWGVPLRWYAAHACLQGLATASLDRVVGRNIERWLPRQPEARAIRRLQNEAQMLLHRHPVNEVREASGALPVNSFWLSGCGAALPQRADDVRFDERLRGPALRGDAGAWHEAWRALDADAVAPLCAAAARGEPARLTLCGERSAVELAPRAPSWWRRVSAAVLPARSNAHGLLESL